LKNSTVLQGRLLALTKAHRDDVTIKEPEVTTTPEYTMITAGLARLTISQLR